MARRHDDDDEPAPEIPEIEMSIQQRAMLRVSGHNIRRLIARLGQFDKCPDCENTGTMPDGACSVHTIVGKTVEEIRLMAKEKNARSMLQSERNRQVAEDVASLKGDAGPAQWNLERNKVVEPVKGDGPGGITVQVGVILPGLPGAEMLRVLPSGDDE